MATFSNSHFKKTTVEAAHPKEDVDIFTENIDFLCNS